MQIPKILKLTYKLSIIVNSTFLSFNTGNGFAKNKKFIAVEMAP
jgi:hypothetical protein